MNGCSAQFTCGFISSYQQSNYCLNSTQGTSCAQKQGSHKERLTSAILQVLALLQWHDENSNYCHTSGLNTSVFFFVFRNVKKIVSKNFADLRAAFFQWNINYNMIFFDYSCRRRKKYEITIVFTISLQFLSNVGWIFWNHLQFFLRWWIFFTLQNPGT